jgi:two-component system LytT family response regulator
MNAIRVVIVDDEPISRRGIRQLLASHPDIEVVGEARHGREAVRMLATLAPDLVFLDVQMPELDGFAVLRELDSRRVPEVIFVTAHDTFAVRAFESQALDYLVKPLHEQRFRDALARTRERLSRKPPRHLVVANGMADLILDVAEIVWIEAEDYYAAIHAAGRRHLVRESLSSLEGRLDRAQFVRVHRSAIVNLAAVREVRESEVVLRDATRLPISRRRRERVAEAVRRFAG